MRIFLGLLLSICFLFAGVDINSASEKEFATLSGIGAQKAKEIISYRIANGCFKSLDELVKVKGIGAKTIEKNKDLLTLGKCEK